MVGEERAPDVAAVALGRLGRAVGASLDHRLRGQAPGEQRLADAFAGHPSVAAAASPANSTGPCESVAVSMRAGIGHARCRSDGVAPAPRASATWAARSTSPTVPLHVLRTASRAAVDAEADVRPTVRERERPRIAGQEVGLEPHDQRRAAPGRVTSVKYWRKACHSPRYRSDRAPRALRDGRPHAVGGDHAVAGLDAVAVADGQRHPVVRDVGRGHRRALVHLRSGLAGDVDQRGVEVRATGDRGGALGGEASRCAGPRPSGARRRRTVVQLATWAGSRPSASSSRRAPDVSPSPQVLSRGNVALSTSATARPARASSMAAAAPAGPAPTIDGVGPDHPLEDD